MYYMYLPVTIFIIYVTIHILFWTIYFRRTAYITQHVFLLYKPQLNRTTVSNPLVPHRSVCCYHSKPKLKMNFKNLYFWCDLIVNVAFKQYMLHQIHYIRWFYISSVLHQVGIYFTSDCGLMTLSPYSLKLYDAE